MIKTSVPIALIGLAICVGWSQTQETPKEAKEPKPPVKAKLMDESTKEDLRVLREGGLKGDGPDLIDYFRKRTYKQPDPKEIEKLVKQLGDDDFATREKAFVSLVSMGASALAGIRQAENDSDLEVRKRVADLKLRIDTKAEPTLQAAAARILALRNLPGTADVLMAFVPFATEAYVVDEIARTLGAVGIQNGKLEPILLKSLEDASAVKRGVAGEAIVRANAKEDFPAVKKLLKDQNAAVRLRICMAMIPVGDKDILPVMVDLMGELTPNELWPIEETLLRLAGDKAPSVSLGLNPDARKKCRDAWAQWLSENEKGIDMAKLVQSDLILGYTLIVLQNNVIGVGGGNRGEIFELDKDKKIRWKIDLPTYPVDAQMLSANRVLIAEYQGGKVTERDLKGEIKWEYPCNAPFAVQRLPNGNTFIATQSRLMEIDRNKNEVWSYQRPQNDIYRARRLPSGEIAFITNLGINATYTRMEPRTQKINKTFNMTQVQMLFGNFDVLPNGHVLVPHYNQHRIVEYDQDGKQVGNPIMKQNWVNSVVRLPNGNTLLTSYNMRRVLELDRNLDEVMSYQTNGTVFVARRR